MITCTPHLIDAIHGEWAVAYERYTGQIVTLVTGIYSQHAAREESERLNNEARARQGGAFTEHHARGTARGWYSDDNP